METVPPRPSLGAAATKKRSGSKSRQQGSELGAKRARALEALPAAPAMNGAAPPSYLGSKDQIDRYRVHAPTFCSNSGGFSARGHTCADFLPAA